MRDGVYVSGSHESIINRDTFAAAQAEIARRAANHQSKPPEASRYPFTGLIRCGKCGSPYKRKHTAAGTKYEKIVWICPTFDTLGKTECGSQQIPENILWDKAKEAGGLDVIAQIMVPDKNQLSFIYEDGTVLDVQWQNPSRRESWTPEMRERARQKNFERAAKNSNEA